MLAFLQQIKLSVTQWVLIGVAGIIGYLVILLKLQKSQLHRSQLSLLTLQFKNSIFSSDEKVAAARKRLQDALKVYNG